MPFPTSSFVQLGQFKNVRVIGQGTFGTVYYAEENIIGRVVAVKEVLPSTHLFQNARAQFEKEARILASLHHQNIVAVYQPLEDQKSGELYLICEYLNGGALDDYLQNRGKLVEQQAIKITLDLCAALETTWAELIVHRDVKPGNIFLKLDSQGQIISAKLGDFGVAQEKRAARTTIGYGVHHYPGTPEYMAPEQGNIANVLDVRADIYALGITLWEMLTCVDYKQLRNQGSNPDLHQYNPATSSGIATIIQRAVQEDPNRRYPTPQHMANDLKAVLQGNPPLYGTKAIPIASTLSPTVKVIRPASPSSSLLSIAVIILFSVLLLGAGALALSGLFGQANQTTDGEATIPTIGIATQQSGTSTSDGTTIATTLLPESTRTSEPQPTEAPTLRPPTATLEPTPTPIPTPIPTNTPLPAPTNTPLPPATNTPLPPPPTTVPPPPPTQPLLVVPTSTQVPITTAPPASGFCEGTDDGALTGRTRLEVAGFAHAEIFTERGHLEVVLPAGVYEFPAQQFGHVWKYPQSCTEEQIWERYVIPHAQESGGTIERDWRNTFFQAR